jgi:hypothetical protein
VLLKGREHAGVAALPESGSGLSTPQHSCLSGAITTDIDCWLCYTTGSVQLLTLSDVLVGQPSL